MKLYIPELGDLLELTSPWKFTLHIDSRNESLAQFFNHYLSWVTPVAHWIDQEILPLSPLNRDYDIDYPNQDDYKNIFGQVNYEKYYDDHNKAYKENPQVLEDQAKYEIWKKEANKIGKKELEVELPIGTVLKVDRIYIRKGASAYSSLSFYAIDLEKVMSNKGKAKRKNNSPRFWAKLPDCNGIKFKKLS